MANMNNNMLNNYNNYPFQTQQQSPQQFFMQPQGLLYFINSALEISNVPLNSGIAVAMCLPEETLYVKTFQNGTPNVITYKLIAQNEIVKDEDKDIKEILLGLDKRLKALEKTNKKGGSLDELI